MDWLVPFSDNHVGLQRRKLRAFIRYLPRGQHPPEELKAEIDAFLGGGPMPPRT